MKKEQEFNLYTIKIKKVREVKKIGVGSYEYKDKLFCVDINQGYGRHVMFCEKTLKKLFKHIKEELYL
jgi:hypothetical protein